MASEETKGLSRPAPANNFCEVAIDDEDHEILDEIWAEHRRKLKEDPEYQKQYAESCARIRRWSRTEDEDEDR